MASTIFVDFQLFYFIIGIIPVLRTRTSSIIYKTIYRNEGRDGSTDKNYI